MPFYKKPPKETECNVVRILFHQFTLVTDPCASSDPLLTAVTDVCHCMCPLV